MIAWSLADRQAPGRKHSWSGAPVKDCLDRAAGLLIYLESLLKFAEVLLLEVIHSCCLER